MPEVKVTCAAHCLRVAVVEPVPANGSLVTVSAPVVASWTATVTTRMSTLAGVVPSSAWILYSGPLPLIWNSWPSRKPSSSQLEPSARVRVPWQLPPTIWKQSLKLTRPVNWPWLVTRLIVTLVGPAPSELVNVIDASVTLRMVKLPPCPVTVTI